ncbi:unnamed protein product [Clonostachys rosea]|uniref:Squalene cyclase N-terminal domain-containing protein n=1 Tax=Bionectria ochroleuca TaxID=29856 RepID=A0ABY6UIW2_BIOOC|nr:unnamed protein product [Clonostachys rosea]
MSQLQTRRQGLNTSLQSLWHCSDNCQYSVWAEKLKSSGAYKFWRLCLDRSLNALINNTDPGLNWGVGETDPKENLLGGIFALLDTQCTTTDESHQLTAAGYDLIAAALGRWLPYNVTTGYSSSPSTATYIRCVYAIGYLLAIYIWLHYIDVVLHSTLNTSTVDGPNNARLLSFVEGGAPLQAIWNMGDISYARLEKMFRNVSDSLTAAVCAAGRPGVTEPARENVMHYATCVELRWGWLAFPAALVVASWALLGMTVRATAGQLLWNASPLALALHWPNGAGLFRSSRDGKHGKLYTEESMEEMAKLITI